MDAILCTYGKFVYILILQHTFYFNLSFIDPAAPKKQKVQYYIEKIPLPTDKKDEEAVSKTTPAETSATAGEIHTETSQTQSSAAADKVFPEPPATNTLLCESAVGGNPTCISNIQGLSHMDVDKEDGAVPTIPKLRRASKKSVSMCETVSVMDETGQVQESGNLKTGLEKSGVMKRTKPEDRPENEDPNEAECSGAGRRKPKGRKCHNVIHMGSESKAECKQQ